MPVHSIVSVEVVLMTEGVDGVHRTTSVRFFFSPDRRVSLLYGARGSHFKLLIRAGTVGGTNSPKTGI